MITLIARFMGPAWGWQDPGGPHVGPMNFAIWEVKAAANKQTNGFHDLPQQIHIIISHIMIIYISFRVVLMKRPWEVWVNALEGFLITSEVTQQTMHIKILTLFNGIYLTLNMRGLSYLRLTRSISCLLMRWLLTSPGHQQPWYWLCRISGFWSYLRKDFKYLRSINLEKWHKM